MSVVRNNDNPDAPPAPLAAAGDTRLLGSRKRSRDEAEPTAAARGPLEGVSIADQIPASRRTFNRELRNFCAERGVTPNLRPVAGTRSVDLYNLLQEVCAAGGYDSLSDPRSGARNWRDLCVQLGLPEHLSFQVKTIYHKNLAAYETARLWGREPPPKELLEDLPAVGGDLLSRTAEQHQILVRSRADAVGRLLRQFFPNEAEETLKRFYGLEEQAGDQGLQAEEEEPQERESPAPRDPLPLPPEQHPDPSHLTSVASDQSPVAPDTLDPRLFSSLPHHPQPLNLSELASTAQDDIDPFPLSPLTHYPEPVNLARFATSTWEQVQKEKEQKEKERKAKEQDGNSN